MKIHGKTVRNALLALLVASGTGAAFAQTSLSAEIHSGPGGTTVDVGYFYDDLASSGNWVESPNYGWVWSPRSVASDWRPYRDGNWVWSDQGWTWVSNESYGWATYHYGRWYDDPQYGWAWVPGNDWAPAWVSWQEGGNYIGWAPLPPSVNVALGFSGPVSVSLGYDAYLFVPERQFLAPRLSGYYVSSSQVPVIYRQTRNITNYRYTDNRVYNTGVAVDRIQRATGHPVQRYTLADLNGNGGGRRAQVQGTRLNVFRPKVQRTANIAPPPSRPIARKAVVTPTQLQASRPNRPGHPAAAQNGARPGAQSQQPPVAAQNTPRNPRNRQANQPTTPATPQERNNPLPTHRTPPAETTTSQPAQRTPKHQVQPNPDQPRTEAPPAQPKRRTPPPPQQDPQDRQRVQPPQQEKQRTPPPPQQDRQRTPPPPPAGEAAGPASPQQERPNRPAPPPEQQQRPGKQQNPKQDDKDKKPQPPPDDHRPPVR